MAQLDKDKKVEQPAISLDQMKKQRKKNNDNFDDIFKELSAIHAELKNNNFPFSKYNQWLEKLEILKTEAQQFYEDAKTYVLSPKDNNAEGHRQLYKNQLRAVDLLEQITFVQRHVERVAELFHEGGRKAREKYIATLATANNVYQKGLQEQETALLKAETQRISSVYTNAYRGTQDLEEQLSRAKKDANKEHELALSRLGEAPGQQFSIFKKYFDEALKLRRDFAEIAAEYKQLAEEVGQYVPKGKNPAVLPVPVGKEGEKLLEGFCKEQDRLVGKLLKLKAALEAADNPAIPPVSISLPKTATGNDIPTIQQTLQAAHADLDANLKAMAGFCSSIKLMQAIQERSPKQREAFKNFQFASFERIAGGKRPSIEEAKRPLASGDVPLRSSASAADSEFSQQVEQFRRLSVIPGNGAATPRGGRTSPVNDNTPPALSSTPSIVISDDQGSSPALLGRPNTGSESKSENNTVTPPVVTPKSSPRNSQFGQLLNSAPNASGQVSLTPPPLVSTKSSLSGAPPLPVAPPSRKNPVVVPPVPTPPATPRNAGQVGQPPVAPPPRLSVIHNPTPPAAGGPANQNPVRQQPATLGDGTDSQVCEGSRIL